MVQFTNGFISPYHLEDHFDAHRSDFDAASEEEYEEMADRFLGGPIRKTTLECIRERNGDVIRYDIMTREFGILSRERNIKTYFKPRSAVHGERTNLAYFYRECKR